MTTREELVKRASAIVPALREGALATEKRRQPLAENVEAMQSAGLISAAQVDIAHWSKP